MEQSQFNRLTDFWVGIASTVFPDYPDLKAELQSRDKIRVADLVFQRLEPACIGFLLLVVGQTHLSTISEGVCYNRLLKVPIQQMPPLLRTNIVSMLEVTFYLGLFTGLYAWQFPTREKISSVNLDPVLQNWMIDAIAPSHVLGHVNREITDIFQLLYNADIEPVLRSQLKIGMFKLGSHRRFFLELYLAGFLLVLDCDMATKQSAE